MESLFSRQPLPRPLTIYERLAPEIEHLHNRGTVRHAKAQRTRLATWVTTFAILLVIGLYFMDPFLYSMNRGDAIRAYLYLHNYDSNDATASLVASHIFTSNEVEVLNNRQGTFNTYFSSRQEAEAKAASVVSYMEGLRALHDGTYDQLGPIGKLRYILFVRSGLVPPVFWQSMNPSVL